MRKIFSVFLVSLFLSSILNAQTITITGKVIEKGTNEPLIGVNVYLAGTSIGASTDPEGNFKFETELKGRFDLIASFLGFKSERKEVIIEERGFNLNFNLEPNLLQMEEVQVSAKMDMEWQKQLADFKRFFLGWDSFANETIIENPEMIDFKKTGSNEITVTFQEPITVTNNALGYKIELEQQKIIFNPFNHSGFWNVYPRFEEMETDNRRLQRKWVNNRKKAFRGSSRHFFMSLLKDDLKRDKFILLPKSNAIEKVEKEALIRVTFPRGWRLISKNYYTYRIASVRFEVAYNPEFTRSGTITPNTQTSTFEANNRANLVVIDRFGNIFNSEEVVFLGPWSDDRFSKTLPSNYID